MKTTNFLHNGSVGDVWSCIPAMREYYRKTGKKVNLYLARDMPAEYYEGAVHPTKSDSGEHVQLNAKMIEMMIPLLMAQPHIALAKLWEQEEIKIDLNEFRHTYVGMPSFSINRWYFYVYPDFACDLSKPWLVVPDASKDFSIDKILINRTERYRNDSISYSFLKHYEDDCLFIGTMREYNNFCMTYDLNIRKVNVSNFLEYAQAIKQSKFYISNQSQGYQLCQGLFHPSILELGAIAPNVIPIGEKMYDFFAQIGLEYYFHNLNGTYTESVIEDFKERNKKPAEAGLEQTELKI